MTGLVVVTEERTVVVTEEDGETLVQVFNMGIMGPPGSDPFTHNQTSPSSEWVINHNRGHKGHVSVLSVGGIEVEANVIHISVNQVRVYFSSPEVGIALVG